MVLKLGGSADKYEYKSLNLENGMRVLLSHDPEADKAAVAVSVKVGSYSDPAEHPGLAHFLEHMLFMGTEEYPDENAYMEYIHMNNGNANANTADEVTNYFYDINPENLRKSMEMFSGFFISPLIREDALIRELQAVNSEHSANILSEDWRRYHLISLLSKQGLPTRKFSVGTAETLGSASRTDLINFWTYFYRPERMCLVVHGKDPLDKLEEWVKECFSGVTAKENNTYAWANKTAEYVPPFYGNASDMDYYIFDNAIRNKVVLYRPAVNLNTDHCGLSISIALPEAITNYRKKTLDFLCELLAGTGSSGFTAVLMKEGIASNVCVYTDETSINTVLHIVVELIEDARAQIPVILDLLEFYMEMIGDNATPALYNVFKQTQERIFEVSESMEPLKLVELAARNMQFYPTEEFVKYEYIWDGLDEEEFKKTLEIAKDKNKWAVLYRTKSVHAEKEQDQIEVDGIYGINYLITDIEKSSTELLNALKGKIQWEFRVPEQAHIGNARTSDLSLQLGTIPCDVPEYPEDKSEVLCKEVSTSSSGCAGYLVNNPKYRKSAEIRVIMQTAAYLEDEKVYAAALGYFKAFTTMFTEKYRAELIFSVVTLATYESVHGFTVAFNGTPVVIEDLVEKFFVEYTARDTQLFTLARESALSHFLQEARTSPYKSSVFGINYLGGYPIFDVHRLMKVARELLPDDLFVIRQAEVRMLGVGNITEKEFARVIRRIGRYITFAQCAPEFTKKSNDITLSTVDMQNVAVSVVHRIRAESLISAVALAALLSQVFSERFFDELRTKEEYGYIVYMSYRVFMEKVYIHFTVQSTRQVENIRARIVEFIRNIQSRLQEMSTDDYLSHRGSAIAAIREEALNLEDYAQELISYWLDIGFDLENKNILCDAIEQVTQADLIAYTENIEDLLVVQVLQP